MKVKKEHNSIDLFKTLGEIFNPNPIEQLDKIIEEIGFVKKNKNEHNIKRKTSI